MCLDDSKSNLCYHGEPKYHIPADPSCLGPMVEGFAWAVDSQGLQLLFNHGKIFQQHKNKASAKILGEETMSRAIFKAGYTIDSLLLAYDGVDWTDKQYRNCNQNKFPARPHNYFGISEFPLE